MPWLLLILLLTVVYGFTYTDVSVDLVQDSYTVGEGDGSVDVCVEIVAITPLNVLECEIVVALTTTDGAKAGNGITCT